MLSDSGFLPRAANLCLLIFTMKPHLPKLLLAALLAVGACHVSSAETVVLNNMTPSYDESGYDLYYDIEDKNISFNGNWQPQSFVDDDGSQEWATLRWKSTSAEQELTLTGSGVFGKTNDSWDADNCWIEIFGPGTFTIGSGVDLRGVYLSVGGHGDEGPTVVKIEGSISGVVPELEVGGSDVTLDLSKATIATSYGVCWGINTRGTMRVANMAINSTSCLQVEGWDYYGDGGQAIAYLDGNMTLAGSSFGINSETRYTWETDPASNGLGYIEIIGDKTTLSVSGNITISGKTTVLYCGDNAYEDGDGNWVEDYGNPDTATPLFICSSITASSLNLLEPYAVKEVYNYDEDEEYLWYKPLAGRKYYAKAGEDGKVYVYLGTSSDVSDENLPSVPGGSGGSGGSDGSDGSGGSGGSGGSTPAPEVPSIPESSVVVGSGDTVILGGDSEDAITPSVDKPIYMQGGTADASALDDDLLNNKVIQGTSGTLVTGADQTMEITTGEDDLSYSIVGADDQTPGADLDINLSGEMKLMGKQYNTAEVSVSGGLLSISSASTVGMGTGVTSVEVESGASLSNYGTIAGDVALAENSTMLNQNIVQGNVELAGKSTKESNGSTMVNNGSVAGTVTVNSGALLSGTGTADAAVLLAGASLHVGNSPGYQKYGSLTIDRGTTISFTVDGTQAASLDKIGAGTHSVLHADELSIDAGTGTVTLNVEVTMGIVNAGFDLVELTLVDAENGSAAAGDFTMELKDNGLLEEGATLTWDAASQSLTLSGYVNKSALAALMDSNASNVANTMWASANAVQEMARTAESQYLIGMPGQTTYWGAAVGSFMDISGGHGFTCNTGGYAVGFQHAFTESFRMGVALGGMFGDFRSDDKQLKVDQRAVLPVLTAQYVTALDSSSSLTVSGHVAYAEVRNEADTYQVGSVGTAEWDDRVLNIGVRAAWNKQLTDNTTVTIFTGLTYQSVDQDSFTEKYTGGERGYRSGSMSSVSLPLGVTLRGVYGMGGTNILVPELTMAYIADIARDNPEVKTRVMGFSRVGKGTNIGRNAFMLSAGANWMFNSSWSVGAFYTLEARSKQVNQSVNASLRYSF